MARKVTAKTKPTKNKARPAKRKPKKSLQAFAGGYVKGNG